MSKSWIKSTSLMALLVLSPALAVSGKLGPSITTTYLMEELQSRPALVELSPGYIAGVTFDDEILSIESGRPELFELKVDAEQQPNKLVIRPLKTAGRTDLRVTTLDGKVAYFIVKITNSNTSRDYRVTTKEPKYASPTTNLSSGDEKVLKVLGDKASKTAAKPAPNTTSTTPSVQVAAAPERAPEAWLPLNLTTTMGKDGTVAIQYSIENNGDARIAIDPARLAVELAGKAVPFRFLASGDRWLDPGKTNFGMILLEGAPAGELKLRWTLTKYGDGIQYTYNRTVNVNAVVSQ